VNDDDPPGFYLPLLLAGAFRSLIDRLHRELAENGHGAARPLHGFALQAIGPQGANISELGRRLGVSKQAAAKTASSLEEAGYLARRSDPEDARAWVLVRTPRGEELLMLSAEIFEELRADWAHQLGSQRLRALEEDLATMVGRGGGLKIGDLPGWLR
jgi:DNA-binding MarR family transcriptional regulator